MHHKLILADNQPVFQTGAARILAPEDDMRIVGQCDTLPKLVKAIDSFPAAVAVFGSSLVPDYDVLAAALRNARSVGVVVTENNQDPQRYLEHGIQGVVYRNIDSAQLITCVRRVARGTTYVQKRSSEDDIHSEIDDVGVRALGRMTPKELQILACIIRGYKNREIARKLGTSEQVIKNYLRSVFDKTGVSDRLELALFTLHHKPLAKAAAESLPIA